VRGSSGLLEKIFIENKKRLKVTALKLLLSQNFDRSVSHII